jgi:subtilisin-like proprotein convertase family protein
MEKIIYTILIFLLTLRISNGQYTENYAASFNGFSSYVSVPNSSGLSPSSAVTLEAWVFPTQLLLTTMAVIGKNYQTSYFLGIQTSGRVVFYPKGGSSFRSRISSVIPVNQWTHIAGTYDGTTTRIFIDGILDTSSTGYTGVIGTNTDSLFIGADRVGTPSLFFKGWIDNVRIWAAARTASQISLNRFSPLEIISPTGDYTGLKASFQLDNNALNYGGSEFNIGHERNLTYIYLNNKAVNYLDYNNNLVLNGTTDYFSLNNNINYNVSNAVTLEAWIKRDTTGSQPGAQNIVNKSGGATGYDYALYILSTGQLVFDISSGSYSVTSSPVITSSQWTHVSASYNTTDGYAILYVNGIYQTSTIFSGHPSIPINTYNLYIGGIGATSYAANKFKGQIDGVRIWRVLRTPSQIDDNMYKIVSDNNLVNFEFDKHANAIRNGTSVILSGGAFAGSAHISSAHINNNSELSSPILADPYDGFYSSGYTNNYRKFYVPDNNFNGITDSVFITSAGNITNLKAYVLMSHTFISDMNITLISPLGTSVTLCNVRGGSGNDIMTIFSDQADSFTSLGTEVNGPGIGAAFSPAVKPGQSLSAFNGQNQQGWWKLKCVDNSTGDKGYVHGWGIKILPGLFTRTLKLTALIQGFYNSSSNKMVKDTARIYLKSANAPYNNLDSSVAVLDSSGKGNFSFLNISNGVLFHIVLKHRNSIETWSSAGYIFSSDTLYYDFTLAASQAYGANQIFIDSVPVKYAVYNGDADKNGFVNLTDIINVYNSASVFITGYVTTDMTGDNITDLTDIILSYNNSSKFVAKITPP